MVPVLFSAGIHGDEINGVEIKCQLITKKNTTKKEEPSFVFPINMFGFNKSRKILGRDLNRVFPGSKMVLSASRFAYHMLTDIHWLITQLIFMQEVPADSMPLKLDSAPNNPELITPMF
jgi:succinylglutamate desuccinylase